MPNATVTMLCWCSSSTLLVPVMVPQVALTLMNLGDNYLAWGKYDEAEQAGREALRIRQKEKDPEAKYDSNPRMVNPLAPSALRFAESSKAARLDCGTS